MMKYNKELRKIRMEERRSHFAIIRVIKITEKESWRQGLKEVRDRKRIPEQSSSVFHKFVLSSLCLVSMSLHIYNFSFTVHSQRSLIH